jgi:two-component system nitrate/nitrite response regulator NarL
MSQSPEPRPTVSVFVADNTRMGCELMTTALRRSDSNLAVAGYATDAVGTHAWLRENNADVAVISAELRGGGTAGFDVTRQIRISHPKTSVIMMLESIERVMVLEAFRAGTSGIFFRDAEFELLCKCIRVVSEGQIWAGNRELRFLLDAVVERRPMGVNSVRKPKLLTAREEGVVQLVAEGFTNRDISRQLNLSENTVRNYLFRIFNKVGTSNRLELALYAAKRGKEQEAFANGND